MEHNQDTDFTPFAVIRHDVRQPRNHQFPRASDTTGTTEERKLAELAHLLANGVMYIHRSLRIALKEIGDDALQVRAGLLQPDDGHEFDRALIMAAMRPMTSS